MIIDIILPYPRYKLLMDLVLDLVGKGPVDTQKYIAKITTLEGKNDVTEFLVSIEFNRCLNCYEC